MLHPARSIHQIETRSTFSGFRLNHWPLLLVELQHLLLSRCITMMDLEPITGLGVVTNEMFAASLMRGTMLDGKARAGPQSSIPVPFKTDQTPPFPNVTVTSPSISPNLISTSPSSPHSPHSVPCIGWRLASLPSTTTTTLGDDIEPFRIPPWNITGHRWKRKQQRYVAETGISSH